MKKILIPLLISSISLSACSNEDLGILNNLKVEEGSGIGVKKTNPKDSVKELNLNSFDNYYKDKNDLYTEDSLSSKVIEDILYNQYKNKVDEEDVQRIVEKNSKNLNLEKDSPILKNFRKKAVLKLAYMYYLDDYYSLAENESYDISTTIYKGILYKEQDYFSVDQESGDASSLLYNASDILTAQKESTEIIKNYSVVKDIDNEKYPKSHIYAFTNFIMTESLRNIDENLYSLIENKNVSNYDIVEEIVPYKNTKFSYKFKITEKYTPTLDVEKVIYQNYKYKKNILVSGNKESILNELKTLDKNLNSVTISDEFYVGLGKYLDELSEDKLRETINTIGNRALTYKLQN